MRIKGKASQVFKPEEQQRTGVPKLSAGRAALVLFLGHLKDKPVSPTSWERDPSSDPDRMLAGTARQGDREGNKRGAQGQ